MTAPKISEENVESAIPVFQIDREKVGPQIESLLGLGIPQKTINAVEDLLRNDVNERLQIYDVVAAGLVEKLWGISIAGTELPRLWMGSIRWHGKPDESGLLSWTLNQESDDRFDPVQYMPDRIMQ